MNNVLGQLLCNPSQANTGLYSCFFDPKNIEGALLVPKGTVYTATQQLTFSTVLATAIANDTVASRIFPIKKFVDFEDKTEESPTQTYGYGGMTKIRQGKYAWTFKYVNSGMALHKALYSFDQMQEAYDVLFIDNKNNCLWGVAVGTYGTSLGGFNLELIDVKNIKLNTGAAATEYAISFCMEDPDEININSMAYQFAPDYRVLANLTGLKNIQMVVQTAMASGLIKLQFGTGDRATQMYDLLSTQLATAGLYTVTRTDTGAAITVTSATATAATKTINLLVDVLDADYIALGATGFLTIAFGNVTALVAAGIVGYGETSISVVRGA